MNINITKRAEQTRYLTTLALAVKGDAWREKIRPLLEDNRLQYEELYNKEFGTYYRARVDAETSYAMLLTHENNARKVTVDVVLAPEGDLSRFDDADYIIFLIRYRAPRHVQLWFRPENTERDGHFVLVSASAVLRIIVDLFQCADVREMILSRIDCE